MALTGRLRAAFAVAGVFAATAVALAAPAAEVADDALPDVWIFSGTLRASRETFSGTLVANKGDAEFELKLARGATCDGSATAGGVGVMRLSEITCSDERTMRALFVPQGGSEMKVYGHVGDERFVAMAHMLGAEPAAPGRQTALPPAPGSQSRPDGAAPKPSDTVPTDGAVKSR